MNKMFALSFQISTLLIIFAKNVWYLYASRLMSGLVCGATIVGIPNLVGEISFDQ